MAKNLEGKVISVFADNVTAKIVTERIKKLPKYDKHIKVQKVFLCDMSEIGSLLEGDRVLISPCRPVSKRKRFKVIKKVS